MLMFLHDRKEKVTNPVTKKIFSIMEEKKTNLCASADLTTVNDLIDFAKKVGPHICILKTHVDILTDFQKEKFLSLVQIANDFNFLIFEDRKFADIGNTVSMQYAKGLYEISSWADIINAHILPGESIIDGLKSVSSSKKSGLVLLAQMSTKNNFFSEEYTNEVVKVGLKNKEFVMGFVCQKKICDDPGFIYFTPGVKFIESSDNLGQIYRSVTDVLLNGNTDIIIVGRDLYTDSEPAMKARIYKELAWELYVKKQKS